VTKPGIHPRAGVTGHSQGGVAEGSGKERKDRALRAAFAFQARLDPSGLADQNNTNTGP